MDEVDKGRVDEVEQSPVDKDPPLSSSSAISTPLGSTPLQQFHGAFLHHGPRSHFDPKAPAPLLSRQKGERHGHEPGEPARLSETKEHVRAA